LDVPLDGRVRRLRGVMDDSKGVPLVYDDLVVIFVVHFARILGTQHSYLHSMLFE
jgi:hypothetical protein